MYYILNRLGFLINLKSILIMAQRVEHNNKYLRALFWFLLNHRVSLGVMLDHSISQHARFWATFNLELKVPPDYGLIFLNNLQTQLSFHTL